MIRSKGNVSKKSYRRRSVSPQDAPPMPAPVQPFNAYNAAMSKGEDVQQQQVTPAPIKTDVGGSAEVKLSWLLQVLKDLESSKHGGSGPPQDAIVNSINMDGTAIENSCVVRFVFEVTTLSEHWTTVRLLADCLSLKNIFVEVIGGEKLGITSEPMAEAAQSSAAPAASEEEGEVMGYVGVQDGYYCLFSSIAAQFVVKLEAEVPYVSARKCGCKFNIPYAVTTKLTWTVPRDIEIKVEPSLSNESLEHVNNTTVVKCQVCPSKFVNVQWTEKEEKVAKPVEAVKVETVVRAEQFSVASVGDGMVSMKTAYDFTFVSGSRAAFDFSVDHDFKVLSVDGNAVRRWEVAGVEDLISLPEAGGKHTPAMKDTSRKRLTVYLNYGVESNYHLEITGEKEMRLASSSTVMNAVIPSIHCLSVEKEKGCIGIQARTNVEVRETQVRGAVRIDTTELPYNGSLVESNRPVLFAYKVSRIDYQIELSVERHDDVGVLVAAVDAAYMTVVWAGIPGKRRPNEPQPDVTIQGQSRPPNMGRCMGSLRMRIRNSQRQYLRVTLPEGSDVWSTNVAGRTVKPARDKSDNSVMVPLEKDRNPFEVQIDFAWEFYSQDLDAPNGIVPRNREFPFKFTLPQVDLPVNRLFLSAYTPEDYWYGEAFGGMDKVEVFSDFPFNEYNNDNDDWRGGRQRAAPQMQVQAQMQMPISYQMNRNVMGNRNEEEEERVNAPIETGVLPVNVSIPRIGKLFRFQRLLVVSDVITIELPCRLDGKGGKGCIMM